MTKLRPLHKFTGKEVEDEFDEDHPKMPGVTKKDKEEITKIIGFFWYKWEKLPWPARLQLLIDMSIKIQDMNKKLAEMSK